MFYQIKKFVGVLLAATPMFVGAEMLSNIASRYPAGPLHGQMCEEAYDIGRKPAQTPFVAEQYEIMRRLFCLNQASALRIRNSEVTLIGETDLVGSQLEQKTLPFPGIYNKDAVVHLFLETDGKKLLATPQSLARYPKGVIDKSILELIEANRNFIGYCESLNHETVSAISIHNLPIRRSVPISREGDQSPDHNFQRNLNASRILYLLRKLSEKCQVLLPIGALVDTEGEEFVFSIITKKDEVRNSCTIC